MKKLVSLVLVCLLAVCALALPVAAEEATPTKVSVLFHYNSTIGEAVSAQMIEELCNVEFDWVYIAKDTAAEKFNLLVQADELPDIILNSQGLAGGASQLYKLGLDGALLDMLPVINEMTPNLKANYETYPDFLKYITCPNGAVYGIAKSYPTQSFARNSNRMYIETSWLENLDLEMPTTADELFDVLMAFKEQDANGNGDVGDEIPFTFASDYNYMASGIAAAFLYMTQNDLRTVDADGNVVFSPAVDAYRDELRFFKKLYDNGLLYAESFTQDTQTVWALNELDADVNTLGVVAGAHKNCACSWESERWMTYDRLYFLTDESGDAKVSAYTYANFETNLSLNAGISDEALAAAARVIDYVATPEGTFLTQKGILGENVMPADEGSLTINGQPAYWRALTAEETAAREGAPSITMTNHWSFWTTYEAGTGREQVVAGTDPRSIWGYYHEGYDALNYDVYIKDASYYWPTGMFMDVDAVDALALIGTDLTSYVKTANLEFISGKRDIEADWDAYLADLERMGLVEYLRVSQEQYDINFK